MGLSKLTDAGLLVMSEQRRCFTVLERMMYIGLGVCAGTLAGLFGVGGGLP